MDISLGLILLIVGISGAAICFVLLMTSWARYAKQRKKLIKFMEEL